MKPPYTLHLAPDGPAVAAQFADFLVEQIAAKEGPFTLALSGGSTPKLLFSILAKEEYASSINWSKLHLFWGDERMVPHDDPESNYGVTKKLLIDHVPIPAVNVHPVKTELEPESAATEYAKEIDQLVAKANGLPRFDLIMLGMGGDGHTASIFPHQMELLKDPNVTGIATHPESGQLRVTLTGPVINNAANVAFLVTGAGKTDRTAQILNQEDGHADYPTYHIQPSHGKLHWFMDEAAATKIDR